MNEQDLQRLTNLLQDFYNLTGMKICIYDGGEEELCYYPEKLSSFCSLLRQDEKMNERCLQCDHHAFAQCKKTHEQYVYTCHAGLIECVSPILYDGKILGYIVLGQVKTDETAPFSYLEEVSVSSKELEKRFRSLPTVSLDKLRSAVHVLDACAGYEYLKRIVSLSQNRIDVALDGYINERIADDLSVTKLCSAFQLSHSEIYSIFKEFFLSTPAEYVKTRRLQHACTLLKTTALPVNKVAVQCGIPDYNYFSKLFKKTLGISPREYRKNNR